MDKSADGSEAIQYELKGLDMSASIPPHDFRQDDFKVQPESTSQPEVEVARSKLRIFAIMSALFVRLSPP